MNNMTAEQKKRRFRELAKQERIRTGRELAEEREQPFLPLINDVVFDPEKRDAQGRLSRRNRAI